jgi:hypothetical protein
MNTILSGMIAAAIATSFAVASGAPAAAVPMTKPAEIQSDTAVKEAHMMDGFVVTTAVTGSFDAAAFITSTATAAIATIVLGSAATMTSGFHPAPSSQEQ